jgi:hypothetical protein
MGGPVRREVAESAYEDALRTAVHEAVAPYSGAAAVDEGWSEGGAIWGMDITPSNSGAAAVFVTYHGGDTAGVGFGKTEVELWDDDPLALAEYVRRFLEAAFAGRFVEAGIGDAFARVTFADGTRASVGRVHLPWPWRLRRTRTYEPYVSGHDVGPVTAAGS